MPCSRRTLVRDGKSVEQSAGRPHSERLGYPAWRGLLLVVFTARHRVCGKLVRIADARPGSDLGGLVRLDGNGLHSQCTPLPSAPLLHLGAGISSWRRCPWLVGGGPVGVRAARTQQHRRGYAGRRVVVIRSRDLEKIRRLVTAVALLLNGRTGD